MYLINAQPRRNHRLSEALSHVALVGSVRVGRVPGYPLVAGYSGALIGSVGIRGVSGDPGDPGDARLDARTHVARSATVGSPDF